MDPRQLIAALALPLFFAAATRIHGRGKFGHTTPLLAAMLFAAPLLDAALGAWPYALLGLLWAIGRKLPFWEGSGAPRTGEERLYALVRQLIVPGLAPPIMHFAGGDQLLAIAVMIPVVLINTGMRVVYGDMDTKADTDAAWQPRTRAFAVKVELVEGFTFGAALLAFAILTHNGVVIP